MEALREESTVAQLAARYDVHPTLIANWKRKAREGLVGVFSRSTDGKDTSRDREIQQLRAKIGELVVERDFLSKAFGR